MYKQGGSNMLQWFYPTSQPSNTPNTASTTNFKINNVDISNNYNGIGTNSNIRVSQIYNINYNNVQNIGHLFELNLPVLNGTIDDDFILCSPLEHDGLLIQILKSMTLSFNYDIDCSFVMVGGGGGGGNQANSNAGGGGGAGELITGSIINYTKGNALSISIGGGGNSGQSGAQTTITYSGVTITANGGGYGGHGKGSSNSVTGSSSGGTGSYSSGVPNVGTATQRTITNISIFQSMTSYNNIGSLGNDQNNDSGGGGGGGGAGYPAIKINNEDPVNGGNGLTITYGTTQFELGGGGGGGSRQSGTGPPSGAGGLGGLGGGGNGGSHTSGDNGFSNTGGGGGGASNDTGIGGSGGSGTVIFYILPSQVRL